MFDPTIVKTKPRVVRSSTGMYVFENAYIGRMRFFANREVKDTFESKDDVVQALKPRPTMANQVFVVDIWNRNEIPEAIKKALPDSEPDE